MEKQPLEFWGIVELFGHQKIAGHVTEAQIAGGVFIRIDVPEVAGSKAFTNLYCPNAVYCMTPTSEELVRAYVQNCRPAPFNIYIPNIRPLNAPDDEDYPDEEDSESETEHPVDEYYPEKNYPAEERPEPEVSQDSGS